MFALEPKPVAGFFYGSRLIETFSETRFLKMKMELKSIRQQFGGKFEFCEPKIKVFLLRFLPKVLNF